jgi:transcriptional regulator with XRE-family HTH domain
MGLRSTLGQRLQELRLARGLTQKELAARAGIQEATLSRYENDIHVYQWESLILLSDALDTSSDYLLGQTDVQAPIRILIAAQGLSQEALDLLETYDRLKEADQDLLMERAMTLYDISRNARRDARRKRSAPAPE